MAILDLSNQYISQSYSTLVQVSSSGYLFDGTGYQLTAVTANSFTGSLKGSSTLIPVAASTTTAGSIYFDTATSKLYIHNGTAWKTASLG